MSISFSCDNCHSPFVVDSQLAGRQARCRKCGRKMRIPSESASGGSRPLINWEGNGSRAAAPARASSRAEGDPRAARGGTAVAQGPPGNSRPISWLDAVNSQVGLKPVTMMSMPAVRVRDVPEEKSVTSYKVKVPRELRPKSKVVTASKQVVSAGYMEGLRSYKQFFNFFAWMFRRINEMSYGFTVVFLIMAIVGVIMDKHSLTVTGISAIVILNVAGLIAGVANLIALRFRKNPMQGLLFLIPPVALYYMWTNSAKWKKPISRIMTPMITLVLVIAAYAYIPWLNGDKTAKGNWKDKLKKGAETLEHDIEEKLSEAGTKAGELKDKLPDEVKNINVDDLKKKAGDAAGGLKDTLDKAAGSGAKGDK